MMFSERFVRAVKREATRMIILGGLEEAEEMELLDVYANKCSQKLDGKRVCYPDVHGMVRRVKQREKARSVMSGRCERN